jgi:opacity protein-like surface antigen
MRIVVFLAMLMLSVAVTAQDKAGGYIGGEFGSFDYEEDLSELSLGDEFNQFDESSTAIKLFGGYRFGDHVGVEADWRKIDDLESSESFFVPDVGTFSRTVGAEIDAITVRVLGYVPLSWGSFIFGGGYFDYDADVYILDVIEGVGPADAITASGSDSGGTAILGLQWELEAVDVRFNYEWFNFEDADAQQIGIGVAYRFR